MTDWSYRRGKRPLAERFWEKVAKAGPDECWLWTGARNAKGYGKLGNLTASRISWELAHERIPDGLFVCHHCDVPACVNPTHLFLGTHRDNMNDRTQKGRTPRNIGERSKSKLTTEQALEIRRRYQAGEKPRHIRRDFGVCGSVVSAIGRGKSWTYLPPLQKAKKD